MTLENVLKVLELSINNKISELDESLLQDQEVRHALTTHFTEQQVRPELTSLIKAPSLMQEYLSLNLEEREELEGFRQENPNYLKGKGEEIRRLDIKFNTDRIYELVKRNRYTEQLLEIFCFYLKERDKNENGLNGVIFGSGFLSNNKGLKKRFGTLGRRVYSNVHRNTKDGNLNEIIKLACEIRPEIKDYTNRQSLFKIESIKQLISFFNFYLENREEGEIFNTNYIQTNKKLKSRFGRKGINLYRRSLENLGNEERNGYAELLELAIKANPNIHKYSTPKELFKMEGVKQLVELFDFFLEKRQEGNIFNPNYMRRNREVLKKFVYVGEGLYKNSSRYFKNDGGYNQLLELAAKERPEIGKYTDRFEIIRIDGPKQLIRCYEFYVTHRKKGEIFNSNYLYKNRELNAKLNGLGKRLCSNARRYFYRSYKMHISTIVKLAAQQRPEILEHWRYTPKREYTRRES